MASRAKTTAKRTKSKSKDPVDAAVGELIRREKEAVAATKLSTFEGAVVDWLFDGPVWGETNVSDDGILLTERRSISVRERFSHKLSAADDKTLGKVRAMLKGIVEAVYENDGAALKIFGDLLDHFNGVADEDSKLIRACEILSHAPKAFRKNKQDTLALTILFLMNVEDRLGAIGLDDLKAIIEGMKVHDGAHKGGPGNFSERGALAEIIARTGAFGLTSKQTARKKIDKAFERRRAGRKPQKTRHKRT